MNNPLVVGYKGEIGSFILQGLLREMPKASDIWCVDVNNCIMEVEMRLEDSDVVFLCLPIDKTVDFLKMYGDKLTDKLIIEQTSLKSVLYEDQWFKKHQKHFNILSMHLLFKPSATPNKADRSLAWISGGLYEQTRDVIDWVKRICDCSDFILYDTWQDHDRDMAIQQTLIHRVIICLDLVASDGGSTFIGKKVSELRKRICNMDHQLFATIQGNPYYKDALEKFDKQLKGFKV